MLTNSVLLLVLCCVVPLSLTEASSPCGTTNITDCLLLQDSQQLCSINYTSPPSCSDSAPATGSCASFNTSTTCHSDNCYWDAYVDACFVAVSQVNQLFSCSYWTGDAGACTAHGCSIVRKQHPAAHISQATARPYHQSLLWSSCRMTRCS